MLEQSPPAPPHLARPPVLALPIALYVSGELIFELYNGGRSCRRFSICWERLVPGKQSEPEAGEPSSPRVLRTHQD